MVQRVSFNKDICKSCSLCVKVCPTNIIFLSEYINGKGYRPAGVIDQEGCISCAKCAQICPDSVITVFRPKKVKQSI